MRGVSGGGSAASGGFRSPPRGRRGEGREPSPHGAHGGLYESALPLAGEGAWRRSRGHRDGEQPGPCAASQEDIRTDAQRGGREAGFRPVVRRGPGPDGRGGGPGGRGGGGHRRSQLWVPRQEDNEKPGGFLSSQIPRTGAQDCFGHGARGAHTRDGEDAHWLGHHRDKLGGGFRQSGGGRGR